MDRRPLVIAHRGGAPNDIENTAGAFRHAIEVGADMLECDVRLTADGHLVLMHDAALQLDGRRVVIADATFDELRASLPWLMTLDEFLEGYGTIRPFNLDLKTHGYEQEVVTTLRRHDLVEAALISTVHMLSLRRLAAVEPPLQRGLSRGHLASTISGPAIAVAERALLAVALPPLLRLAGAGAAMLQHRIINPALVRGLHDCGFRVFTWTVDHPPTAIRLAHAGVDGIASNTPARIIAALGEARQAVP